MLLPLPVDPGGREPDSGGASFGLLVAIIVSIWLLAGLRCCSEITDGLRPPAVGSQSQTRRAASADE